MKGECEALHMEVAQSNYGVRSVVIHRHLFPVARRDVKYELLCFVKDKLITRNAKKERRNYEEPNFIKRYSRWSDVAVQFPEMTRTNNIS
ncbi:Protein of unknown function [Gryllus bimaculatus]|nr:Protein of unknown function [Gryllus bimaculatus]